MTEWVLREQVWWLMKYSQRKQKKSKENKKIKSTISAKPLSNLQIGTYFCALQIHPTALLIAIT